MATPTAHGQDAHATVWGAGKAHARKQYIRCELKRQTQIEIGLAIFPQNPYTKYAEILRLQFVCQRLHGSGVRPRITLDSRLPLAGMTVNDAVA